MKMVKLKKMLSDLIDDSRLNEGGIFHFWDPVESVRVPNAGHRVIGICVHTGARRSSR